MWELDSAALAELEDLSETSGAPIASTSLGTTQAPLAEADYLSSATDPLIQADWTPTTITPTLPAPSGGTVTLDLSGNDLVELSAIAVGGQIFGPAENPENPVAGEFVWNPATGTVTLTLDPDLPLQAGLQVQVLGGMRTDPTNWIDPSLLSILSDVPVRGKLSLTLSAEQHPTAQLSLYTSGSGIHSLRSRFQRGRELTIGGVGFSVGEFSEELQNTTDYPGLFWAVSIALTGKWARPKYNELSFFDPASASATAMAEEAFTDPNCTLQTEAGGTGELKVKTVSLSKLASQVNASFSGSGKWRVPIPENAPGNAATQWTTEMQNLLRQNNCIVDWNDPGAVRGRSLSSVRSWSYTVPSIRISYQGDCERSPDHRGYGYEYKNWTLDGKFLEILNGGKKEPTQGDNEDQEPQWQRRVPVKQTVPSGIQNPPPPADARTLSTLSLNWDVSGDTEEYSESDLEDGQPVRVRRWIYGWAYTADEIANPSGELEGSPDLYWGVVEYRSSTYEYDPEYRVLVKISTNGWTRRRFLQEEDAQLQTLTEDAARANLYRFQTFPIFERSQYLYGQFYDYYADYAQFEAPSYNLYQVPTRAGTCQWRVAYDPNWAPALFLIEEKSYANIYASTPNPDSTADRPLPPLIVGEERQNHRRITVLPSINTKTAIGGTVNERQQEDRYKEEVWESAPQGPGFQDQSSRGQETLQSGKPPQAQTLPPPYELIEPDEQEAQEPPEDDADYEYRIRTPGWSINDPVGGSYSAPYALTLDEAYDAAKANLKVQDILTSVRYQTQIPFNLVLRPFDRVTIHTQAESFATRAISITHDITLDSLSGSVLLTAAPSSLEAGIDRTISCNRDRIRKPRRPDRDNAIVRTYQVREAWLTVGDIVPFTLRTRRNPNGQPSAA